MDRGTSSLSLRRATSRHPSRSQARRVAGRERERDDSAGHTQAPVAPRAPPPHGGGCPHACRRGRVAARGKSDDRRRRGRCQLPLGPAPLLRAGGVPRQRGRRRAWLPARRLQSSADLVILDLGLPGFDGFDVLAKIRRDSGVPVIVCSGRDSEHDRIRSLNLGADDFVVKPFSFAELEARVRAVLRRGAHAPVNRRLHYGDLVIDRDTRAVLLNDTTIPMTRKEFDLLAFLAASPGGSSPVRSCSSGSGRRRTNGRGARPSPSTCAACA